MVATGPMQTVPARGSRLPRWRLGRCGWVGRRIARHPGIFAGPAVSTSIEHERVGRLADLLKACTLPPSAFLCSMAVREYNRHRGFWPLALLWLPAGVMATAAVLFLPDATASAGSGMWPVTLLMSAGSLVFVAPCGLPLSLGCRRLWRLGYRRTAWMAGIGLGAVTVAASLVAGLLGPLAIAIYAAVLSLPVWVAWWWLSRRG